MSVLPYASVQPVLKVKAHAKVATWSKILETFKTDDEEITYSGRSDFYHQLSMLSSIIQGSEDGIVRCQTFIPVDELCRPVKVRFLYGRSKRSQRVNRAHGGRNEILIAQRSSLEQYFWTPPP